MKEECKERKMPADEVHQSSQLPPPPPPAHCQVKTFAFLPIDGHGHVNAMIGLADQLRSLGHRTVFVCNDNTSARYFGHELILVRPRSLPSSASERTAPPESGADSDEQSARANGEENIFIGDERLNSKWAQMVDLLDLNVNKPECVVKSLAHNYSLLKLTIEQEIIPVDERIEQILIDLQPDLVVVDQLTPIPAIHRLAAAAAAATCTIADGSEGIEAGAEIGIGIGIGAGAGAGIGIGMGSATGSSCSSADPPNKQEQVFAKAAAGSKPFRWISLCSCNPMPLYHGHSLAGQFPPPLMALSASMESGVSMEVQQLRFERILRSSGMLAALARLVSMSELRPELISEQHFKRFCRNESSWLNLYMFPAKLDYAGERGLANLPPDRYHRVDCLIRAPRALSAQEEALLGQVHRWRSRRSRRSGPGGPGECAKGADSGQEQEQESELKRQQGEGANKVLIVYLSMGTTMSLNLELMEALLEQVFACLEAADQVSWRFLVALGPRARLMSAESRRKLERWTRAGRLLAAGWWPQPELMRRKLIDVGLCHGGNNTICELFHFKVPALIVVPAFHDQLDNARRVADLNLGVSLPATELLAAKSGNQDDGHDLLLLRSLRRAVELAEARGSFELAADPSSSGRKATADEANRRDSHYCARLLESKLAQWDKQQS